MQFLISSIRVFTKIDFVDIERNIQTLHSITTYKLFI